MIDMLSRKELENMSINNVFQHIQDTQSEVEFFRKKSYDIWTKILGKRAEEIDFCFESYLDKLLGFETRILIITYSFVGFYGDNTDEIKVRVKSTKYALLKLNETDFKAFFDKHECVLNC